MHALILATFVAAQSKEPTAVVVKFDALTLKDVERLDGRLVVTNFTLGAAAYTWGEGKARRTVTGPGNSGGLHRSVILKGNRLHNANLGTKVTVLGILRVARPPAPATVVSPGATLRFGGAGTLVNGPGPSQVAPRAAWGGTG